MIYADVFQASANGDMTPQLFEESITVCEVSMSGSNVDNVTSTGIYTISWEELLP